MKKIFLVFLSVLLVSSTMWSPNVDERASAAQDFGTQFITEVNLYKKDTTNPTLYEEFYSHFTVDYKWVIPDGTAIATGDTMTIKLPPEILFTNDNPFKVMMEENCSGVDCEIGTGLVNQQDSLIVVTFNDKLVGKNTRNGTLRATVQWNTHNETVKKHSVDKTDVQLDFKLTSIGSDGIKNLGVGVNDPIPPDEVLQKWGWYNSSLVPPNNNVAVNWDVRVNYAKKTIENAIIKDSIESGHRLVPNSVKVFESIYQSNHDQEIGTEITNSVTINQTENAFEVQLGTINRAYTIRYQTEILDGGFQHTYSNTATLLRSTEQLEQIRRSRSYEEASGTGSGVSSPDIIVTKKDEQDNPIVGGVKFNVVNSAGTVIYNGLTTNENGQFGLANLPVGSYTLVETEAPTGYILDNKPIQFEVVAGNSTPIKISVVNKKQPVTPLPPVEVLKTDEQTGAVLAGAVFRVEDSTGHILHPNLTTGSDGKVQLPSLPVGTYYLIETAAPAGYVASEEKKMFEVKEGTALVTVEFKNKKSIGSVELFKKDSVTGEPVKDAVFELRNGAGDLMHSNLKTNEAGKLVIPNLQLGMYKLTEVSAPMHYALGTDTSREFEIKTMGEVVQLPDMTNKKIVASVELTKQDSLTSVTLQGAEFRLEDQAGNVIRPNLVTDVFGKIKVENLTLGSYKFIETKAPIGYQLAFTTFAFTLGQEGETVQVLAPNSTIFGSVELLKVDEVTGKALEGAVFTIVDAADPSKIIRAGLKTDGAGKLIINNLPLGNYQFIETTAPAGYALDSSPIAFAITMQQLKATVTKKNKKVVAAVELIKKDEVTGKALQGATFNLLNQTGKVVHSGLMTGADGKITVQNLEVGMYSFVETKAPEGYEMNSSAVPFVITESTKLETVTKTNKQIKAAVELTKTDEADNKALAGAIFNLEDSTGTVVRTGLTTNEQGKITVDQLPLGTYYFVETTAPQGYMLATEKQPFTLVTANERVAVTMTNKRSIGTVELTKTDEETGETLAGATFELRDAQGRVIKNGTTDATGQLALTNIPLGSYQLVETNAPTGYLLDSTPLTVTIAKVNDVVEIKRTNVRMTGTAILTKTDEETGEALAGAVFELRNEAGQVVASNLSTNEVGQLTAPNLGYGRYTFTEISAPAGYIKGDQVIAFAIQEQDNTVYVTATNKKFKANVEIIIEDTITGEPVPNVVLDIFEPVTNEPVYEDLVTDEEGKVQMEELPPGQYRADITYVPEGYTVDPTPMLFEVVIDGEVEQVFTSTTMERIPQTNVESDFDESIESNQDGNVTPVRVVQTLPRTNGADNLPLILFGLLLIIAAAFLTRKTAK